MIKRIPYDKGVLINLINDYSGDDRKLIDGKSHVDFSKVVREVSILYYSMTDHILKHASI